MKQPNKRIEQVQEIILKKIKFAMTQRVSDYALASMDVRHLAEQLSAHTVFAFEALLAGQSKIQTYDVEYEFPSSWWQHFKLDHLKWLTKWFPAKMEIHKRTVTFNHQVIFPDINLPKTDRVIYHTPQPMDDRIKQTYDAPNLKRAKND